MITSIFITLAEITGIIVSFIVIKLLINSFFQLISGKISKKNSLQEKVPKMEGVQRKITGSLVIICFLLCTVVIAINSILIYREQNITEVYFNLFNSIPREFWLDTAIALLKCISLLMFIKLILPSISKLLDRICKIAQDSDQISTNDESIGIFFASIKKISANTIWLASFIFCGYFLNIPEIIIKYLFIVLKAYLAFSLGQSLVKLVSVLIDTLDALSLQYSDPDNLLHHYERFRHLVPALKKALTYISYVAIAGLIIQDIDSFAWMATYSDEIIRMIGLYFICGFFIQVANIILDDFILRADKLSDLQKQRRLTIIPLVKSVLKYLTYFFCAVSVLNLIGIDPAPILAGAGIVGLAMGFGAQNLINDVVCGFFILFENYYLVGDYIEAGKEEERMIEGTVEAIELRTTHLRHPDGQLQIIRNGDTGSIVNYSKNYSYSKVDVPVPIELGLAETYKLIDQVGKDLHEKHLDILEPTRAEGLEKFESEHLIIRTMTRVKPGKHLHIARLVRSEIKMVFERKLIDGLDPDMI